MKKLWVLLLIIVVSHAKADVEIVPLDMELGYWEITAQINIEDILDSIPLEQRATAGAMMSSKIKIPVIKQRITQDTLDNPAFANEGVIQICRCRL